MICRTLFIRKFSLSSQAKIAPEFYSDRSKLLRLLLNKNQFESFPVQITLKKIYRDYQKDIIFYNNLLSVYVKSRIPSYHVENLLKEMKIANVEPDNYTHGTMLFYFCINKAMDKAELLAESIKDIDITGTFIQFSWIFRDHIFNPRILCMW